MTPLSTARQSLDVTSVGRATIAIPILGTRSRGTGGGLLLLAPGTEPVLLGLFLAHLNVGWGGVDRQSVHATTGLGVVLLAAPPLTAGAVGVVVGGGGAEALLALVVAGQEDLEEDGDEEEEAREITSQYCVIIADGVAVVAATRAVYLHSNDRDCKGDLLQLASHVEASASRSVAVVIGIAVTQRGLDVSTARLGAVASQDSDRDHGTHEANIEHDTEEGEEGDSA